MAITTTNPATGETLEEFEELTSAEVDEKLQRAAETFRRYRTTTFAERAGWLRRAAEILDDEADRLGALATLEMGKTLTSAQAEVRKCAKAAAGTPSRPSGCSPTSRTRCRTRRCSPGTSRSARCSP